jgi:ABC-type transporter Mla subunit MlaD
MQYDKIKISVAIFVILLFLAVGYFTYFLMDAKGMFEKRYVYYFSTNSASSFNVGMPVEFSGFKIGQIQKIKLKDDGNVNIYFFVFKKYRKWINKYTYLLLKKPLLGSPIIEVWAAGNNGYLKENSKLPIILSDDINDLITKFEPVLDKLTNIIANIEKITIYLSSDNSPLNKSLENIEKLSSKLANSDSLLTSITGDKKSTEAFINSLYDIKRTLKNIKDITDNLNETIIRPSSDSIKELHAILKDVNNKLKKLQPLVDDISNYGDDLKNIKEDISLTIKKSNDLMDKVDAVMKDSNKNKVKLP